MDTKPYALTTFDSFHSDLQLLKTLVYDKCGFELSNPTLHTESREYGACSFKLNGWTMEHRVAKITPTKSGQFVTIWKRNKDGLTTPFHLSDKIDFILITCRKGAYLGQFIFPLAVLANKGFISQNQKAGKRGMRVYPPWDITDNQQAKKTQLWQNNYFMSVKQDGFTNIDLFYPNKDFKKQKTRM